MARRGRTCKLTTATAKQIVDDVKLGLPFKLAAQRSGIDSSTMRRWRIKGEKTKRGIFARFAQDVKKAEIEAIRASVAHIRAAAVKEWTAAAWYLERRCPEEFARRDRMEHSGPEGRAIPIKSEGLAISRDLFRETVLLAERNGLLHSILHGSGSNGNGSGNGKAEKE